MSRVGDTLIMLHKEIQILQRAIYTLEKLETIRSGKPVPESLDRAMGRRKSNRGRKFMGLEERKVVSERMKKYWASRRKKA